MRSSSFCVHGSDNVQESRIPSPVPGRLHDIFDNTLMDLGTDNFSVHSSLPSSPHSTLDGDDELNLDEPDPLLADMLPEANPMVQACLEDLQIAQTFIQRLKNASFQSEFTEDELEAFLNPPSEILELDDPDFQSSLEAYLLSEHTSEKVHADFIKILRKRIPDGQFLSYNQMRRCVRQITGIVPLVNDMCISSCMAYTGPFSDLDTCQYCGQPCYDGNSGKARQTFITIPLGPQIQAMYRHPKSAMKLRDRLLRTRDVLEQLQTTGKIASYNDGLSDKFCSVADGKGNW
jgi:hypothetical protein